MLCNVCDSPLGEPIFASNGENALTSLCERQTGRVQVWSCRSCTHLLGAPLAQTEAYYASDYRILLNEEDEDQIYEVRDDRVIYRTDHQIAVLDRMLAIPEGALVLDYGCAKAAMPKRLLKARPDLQMHLFDVSDMYLSYWDRLVPSSHRAINETPVEWTGRFDVVTSFFALEHIPSPLETVRKIASLLKDGGVFYTVIPDTFGNVADFVVIDHVNHFTELSIRTLLGRAGFGEVTVDNAAHRGALVVKACKTKAEPVSTTTLAAQVSPVLLESDRLAAFWSTIDDGIRSAERRHAGRDIAIYGSGFYGAYIHTALVNRSRVRCFLDKSPFQQGKVLFGVPIIAPEAIPSDVDVLFVGLNPVIAREAISQLDLLLERNVTPVFLDGLSE